VKPWQLLGEALAPDGTLLALTLRDREYVIHAAGRSLMSSRMHGSEEAAATLACRHVQGLERPHVLVGGLGMGFTLRAALDHLPPDAIVTVAELVPAVVEWNLGPLGPLAGHPLRDPRVRLQVGDVAETLRAAAGRFHAIVLDVDNGPAPFTASGNAGLYDDRGIAALRAAMAVGGVVSIWSARDDRAFVQRLRHAGFDVRVEHVRARLKKGGPLHTIFLGFTDRSSDGRGRLKA